jgi:predicted aldo/keto reductase-like oxidoreductase
MIKGDKMKRAIDRRKFIKQSALGIAGTGLLSNGLPLLGEQETTGSPLKIKKYRTLGRTGFKVSEISSGMPQNEAVLNRLLDAGVNYIDVAASYSNGKFEQNTGNALKNRDRKAFFITTKLDVRKSDTRESFLKRTGECLERLQTGYIDCMMVHSAQTVEKVKSPGFHAAMKQLKKEGKVRFVGVACHGGSYPTFGRKIDSMEKVLMTAAHDGRFDVFLMVHNFLTKESSERILKVCKEKKIGVTLMKVNPVSDYFQVNDMIKELENENKKVPRSYELMRDKFKEQAEQMQTQLKMDYLKNPAKIREAAIRFVLDNPTVHTVCCTCLNFDQADTFIKLSGMPLTGEDQNTLAAYQQAFGKLYCRHGCGLCESRCPQQVPVNTIMRYNHYFVAQGRQKHAMSEYKNLPGHKADLCSNCPGFCETACPYNVSIHALLNLAHKRLTLT